MTVLEQEFMERVPYYLQQIAASLKVIAENMEAQKNGTETTESKSE